MTTHPLNLMLGEWQGGQTSRGDVWVSVLPEP